MNIRFLSLVTIVTALAGAAAGPTSLTGAGATFPYPMYSKWFSDYHKQHANIEINYQSIGSGGGIKQVTEGTVDFGASDGPMTDQQIQEFKAKRHCDVLHFPTVVGADVPTYHLPGVSAELNFTPEALAGIFLGKITRWNDAELAKVNPKVKLPDHELVVVHRSEASGTTYVWVDYLAKVSPQWKQKVGVGTAVSWPVGLGGKGNEGVTGQIKQTEYSIGYVELVYAVQNNLPHGRVRNSSGNFVKADLTSVTAAAAAANMPDDFRVSITNPSGKDAYPIASFTWLLVPGKINDPAKKQVITDFLKWMLGPGQKLTEALTYAQLPKQIVAKEIASIAKIQ